MKYPKNRAHRARKHAVHRESTTKRKKSMFENPITWAVLAIFFMGATAIAAIIMIASMDNLSPVESELRCIASFAFFMCLTMFIIGGMSSHQNSGA